MNNTEKCSCPNCGSEKKQAIGEILPYKPSGVLLVILGLFMVNGIWLFLAEGTQSAVILCIPVFIYCIYALSRHFLNPKHLIKYLCLDCSCQYFVEIPNLEKKKDEVIKEKLDKIENKKTEEIKNDTKDEDIFKEIREYKKLLDEGIISEKEFEEKKKSILNIK